jgi:hypothetical protein
MSLLSFFSTPTNHAARRGLAALRFVAEPATEVPAVTTLLRTPEAMRSLYYTNCSAFYSEEFKAGFMYMANVLCGAPARRPLHPIPSAAYDACAYGMQQAQEFAQSPEWQVRK